MDRLRMLRTFILVADHQSFAEAARKLHISPTQASRGIAQLEAGLGVSLLSRTTRSVGLTPEGAAYLERCRRILDELDDADQSLRGEHAAPRGKLRIAAPVVFGRMHVLPIVAALLKEHRELNVELSLSDRIVRLVEEGIDATVRIADLSDSALHAIRLAEVRRVLVATPEYLARNGTPSEIAQLHDHDLIAFEFPIGYEWRFTTSGRPSVRVEPRLSTNSVAATLDAVLEHLGIARLFSYQVQEQVAAGRLVYLLEEFEPPPVPVSLVFQGSRRSSPNVSAFIRAAQAYCRGRAFD